MAACACCVLMVAARAHTHASLNLVVPSKKKKERTWSKGSVAFIGNWKVDGFAAFCTIKGNPLFSNKYKHMNVLEKETGLELFLARHLFVHPHAFPVLPPGLQRGQRVFLGALIHGVPAMANLHGAATCSGDA
jgi:hypothetical protein